MCVWWTLLTLTFTGRSNLTRAFTVTVYDQKGALKKDRLIGIANVTMEEVLKGTTKQWALVNPEHLRGGDKEQ